MNATIDAEGPSDYAELDEFGRYKVQLPFDNSDKNAGKGSARIRMASPYAGSDHGMNFPLHKDAEVLLSFINGNPDEPVITGAVPNSENPSLVNYNNPYESKITTAGGNRIHMGDKKGKEFLRLYTPFNKSSISLGSPDGSGESASEGGISIKSEGYTETITIGNASTIVIGAENKINIGNDNWTLVSPSNKTWIGPKMDLSFGGNLEWNFGERVEINDTQEYNLNKQSEVCGYQDVSISGGQNPLIIADFEATKVAMRRGMLLAAAVNTSLAVAAGTTATENYSEDTGVDISKASIALGVATTFAAKAYSRYLIKYKKIAPYISNIELKSKGIDISVRPDITPTVWSGSKIELSDHEIESKVDYSADPEELVFSSSLSQSSAEIEMEIKMKGFQTIYNKILVSDKHASMIVRSPESSVVLQHYPGGTLKLDSTGLKYKNEVPTGATISAGLNGTFQMGTELGGIYGNTTETSVGHGGNAMNINAEGINFVSVGPLKLKGATLEADGLLIKLG
jgi:type VI secretion system secreted protein VgrG